jgi:hypothetical protein
MFLSFLYSLSHEDLVQKRPGTPSVSDRKVN